MSKVICVRIVRSGEGWILTVTKQFDPEYGGGAQNFDVACATLAEALVIARGMTEPPQVETTYRCKHGKLFCRECDGQLSWEEIRDRVDTWVKKGDS